MRITESKNGIIIGIIGMMQDRYSGAPDGKLQDVLYTLSRHGVHGVRFGAMPYGGEWELTPPGRREFDQIFPVTKIITDPRINEAWRERFRARLELLKSANLLPVVYLYGGCDNVKLMYPTDYYSMPACQLYERAVVFELQRSGMEYILETGNEIAGLVGDGLIGAGAQNAIVNRLVDFGADRDWIRVSSHDDPWNHNPDAGDYPDAEWLQVILFSRDGGFKNPFADQNRYHIGFSQHCVACPDDFLKDRYMGRIEVNDWQNYKDGIYNNIYCSTDGAGYQTGEGNFKGVPTEKIGQLYLRFLQAVDHPQAGTCSLFEHLPNEAIEWDKPPNMGGVATVRIGQPTLDRVDRMADVYHKFFGVGPYNKLHPVGPKPPDPPKPPSPPEPIIPEEEKPMKLFTFSKRFPFLSVHYLSWKKSLTQVQRKVHYDTALLMSGLFLVGLAVWRLINWII